MKEKARSLYAGKFVILAGEAYQLNDLVITSIRTDRANSQKKKCFNRIHKSTRVVIENALGLLKKR